LKTLNPSPVKEIAIKSESDAYSEENYSEDEYKDFTEDEEAEFKKTAQ
jgi:hypothetical protein